MYLVKGFLKTVPRSFNEDRTAFTTKDSGDTGYAQAEEWSWTLTLNSIPHWSKNQIYKTLNENSGGKLYDIGFCNDFLDMPLYYTTSGKHYPQKANKLKFIKTEHFVQRKISIEWKGNLQNGRQYLPTKCVTKMDTQNI